MPHRSTTESCRLNRCPLFEVLTLDEVMRCFLRMLIPQDCSSPRPWAGCRFPTCCKIDPGVRLRAVTSKTNSLFVFSLVCASQHTRGCQTSIECATLCNKVAGQDTHEPYIGLASLRWEARLIQRSVYMCLFQLPFPKGALSYQH
jgi:hypothetical protein